MGARAQTNLQVNSCPSAPTAQDTPSPPDRAPGGTPSSGLCGNRGDSLSLSLRTCWRCGRRWCSHPRSCRKLHSHHLPPESSTRRRSKANSVDLKAELKSCLLSLQCPQEGAPPRCCVFPEVRGTPRKQRENHGALPTAAPQLPAIQALAFLSGGSVSLLLSRVGGDKPAHLNVSEGGLGGLR